MKTKWYISTCIAILALWGIVHNHASLPNQEVLVSFHNQQVTSEQTQDAIAFIEQELQDLGVTHIEVEQASDQLKISYHSSLEVEAIQEVLAKATHIKTATAKVSKSRKSSKEEGSKAYDVAVHKIQKTQGQHTNSSEQCAVLTKHDFDRATNAHVTLYVNELMDDLFLLAPIQKTTISNTTTAYVIQKTYAIPEVRAGPTYSFQIG